MNVIITNLSTPKNGEPKRYHSDKGDFFGVNTNEAPIQYLLSCLKEQNEENKIRIIAITTPEAEKTFDVIRKTALEFAQREHMQLDENEILKVANNEVANDEAANNEFSRTIREIISLVNSGDKVYLDTTGGKRNAVYFLMTLVRILEYSKVILEKAVYSNYSVSSPCWIEDITSDYQRLNLINSAELFTYLGNANGLKKFFAEKDNPEINNVIDAMNKFSEAVALCRTSELDKILEQLNDSLTELDSMTPTTPNEILFQSISGVIREKFGIHEDGHKTIDYVDIISWCLENKQIQQAATIYTEKIGEYLLQKKYYTASDEKFIHFKTKFPKSDTSYKLFSDGFMKIAPSKIPVPLTFLNFLEHAKENEKISTALLNAPDAEMFKSEVEIEFLDEKIQKALERFFILKNTVYTETNERRPQEEILKNLEEFPEFIPVLEKITARKKETFLNKIMTKKKCLEVIQGYPILEMKGKKARTIEYLEYALSVQDDYHLLVPTDTMQNIMRDFIYIRWLRNSFNHASDKNNMVPDEKQYLENYGYSVKLNVSLEDTTKMIRNALTHLKK